MEIFPIAMQEYRKQLELGMIQTAYRGLMEYMLDLRTHFKNKYPDYVVSGSLYFGYMDMTYFSFFPKSLKERNLKVALVFIHGTFKFEVWLAGYNKQAQNEYWELFKKSGWDNYRLPASVKGADSILEHTLADNPDFSHLDELTQRIEAGTLEFIEDVEGFLARG